MVDMDWAAACLVLFGVGLAVRSIVNSFFAKPRRNGSWVPTAGVIVAIGGLILGPPWLVVTGVVLFAAGEFYFQVIARG